MVFIKDARESLLDREIEMKRQMLMKESRKRQASATTVTAKAATAAELTEIGDNSSKLDIEIEEIWQLMMQQSKWRKIEIAASKINQKLNLMDRKKKMEQKTSEVQRKQRNKAFGQLQNKIWDPGRPRPQDT